MENFENENFENENFENENFENENFEAVEKLWKSCGKAVEKL